MVFKVVSKIIALLDYFKLRLLDQTEYFKTQTSYWWLKLQTPTSHTCFKQVVCRWRLAFYNFWFFGKIIIFPLGIVITKFLVTATVFINGDLFQDIPAVI